MDVFGIALAAGAELMGAAAIDCGYELGVFGASRALDTIADDAGLGAGRRRLRALLDVLVAIGALARDGDRFTAATVPPRPVVVRAGWGLAADVIRRDRALPVSGGALELRYHQHLLAVGAAPARELAVHLGAGPLVDLGGGAGTYTRAFLAHRGEARATIVDFHEVVALARVELAPFGGRVRYLVGDLASAPVGDGCFGVALLANVLHLHDAATCARLVAAAARAVAPGGIVVIKELRVDDGRRGPVEGLFFALNLALYTGGGDVYATRELRAWLAAAGLVDLREVTLASAPEGICLVATRPVS